MKKIITLFLIACVASSLSGCMVVTVPAKVALGAGKVALSTASAVV